ncbi:type III-B CRISPR module-associated protein Cmr5 [Caenispirillum bisanense]|uniref:type III-B CRISPR module-associated protein Cmr5 n=1 Tax=Caenispirillum bisanense TaxID=414052 RepID=UPI0031D953F6
MMLASDRKRDLGLRRATFAFRKVNAWSPSWAGEARALVQGLPVQVRSQGLLVTVGVLAGRSGSAGTELATLVAEWVLGEDLGLLHAPGASVTVEDLLKVLSVVSRAEHVAAQRETILLLDQVKVFAKALAPRGAA